jgi:hypothetical protein
MRKPFAGGPVDIDEIVGIVEMRKPFSGGPVEIDEIVLLKRGNLKLVIQLTLMTSSTRS